MNKIFQNLISIFKNKPNTNIYSIQELKDRYKKEKKITLARKNREYIYELNKRQRIWLEKTSRKFRKVS